MRAALGVTLLALCAVATAYAGPSAAMCSAAADEGRIDCYPEPNASQSGCEARGCCWEPASAENDGLGEPWCFYPADYGYTMTDVTTSANGFTGVLTKSAPASTYGGDIATLAVTVSYETANRVNIKVTDPAESRFEVPIEMPVTPGTPVPEAERAYSVSYTTMPFGVAVTRKSTGTVVWNSTMAGFIYSDQFIQWSSRLSTKYLYGLGEHVVPLLLPVDYTDIPLWTRDQGTPEGFFNLYGAHAVFQGLEEGGLAHGVYVKNSNAMDVVLTPTPSITYRTIGGVIDMYVVLGPSPEEVVQQYTEIVGTTFMPPYWALGYQLCRWHYGSLNQTEYINSAVRAYGIPQDGQWNDIDYMNVHKDFTIGTPYTGLGEFVDTLHTKYGQHYVMIVDPSLSSTQPAGSYPPYDLGMKMGVFVNASDGSTYIGNVWPGPTAFPDFWNPVTKQYWLELIADFHKQVAFDGLWTDMNEPDVIQANTVCGDNKLNNPPYVPHVTNNLDSKTICLDAQQHLGSVYNLHSTYGYSEMVATMDALQQVRGKRSLVLSRSTFPNAGAHGAHWLGDNTATWDDLYLSIPGMLNFQLFGIPLAGADICGFNGATNYELCMRWTQLGAFYAWSRNHNSIGQPRQDPAAFGATFAGAARSVLLVRYTMLPYLYTLFHESHAAGGTVVRPLFFTFPADVNTYAIDRQFTWGSGLLITPVLTQGATTVTGYFPDAIWYDFYTGAQLAGTGTGKGSNITLQAPMTHLPLHVKGGSIIPTQQPAMTTTVSSTQPFGLLIALDEAGQASGTMFIDDGESLNSYESGDYVYLNLTVAAVGGASMLTSMPLHAGYAPAASTNFGNFTVFGVPQQPAQVTANGSPVAFEWADDVLSVTSVSLPPADKFTLTW